MGEFQDGFCLHAIRATTLDISGSLSIVTDIKANIYVNICVNYLLILCIIVIIIIIET